MTLENGIQMMKRSALLLVVLLCLASCSGVTSCRNNVGPEPIPAMSSEKPIDDAGSATEVHTDAPQNTGDLLPSTIPHEIDGDVIAYRSFFGKTMMNRIAELNLKTLENEQSGLFDLLSDLRFTAEDVLRMIESYSCESFTKIDGAPFTEEQKKELIDYRNLTELQKRVNEKTERIDEQFAILTENADLRSFPTDVYGQTETSDPHFDLFQETKLLYATGIRILWSTEDRVWYFVQGENYYGWIRAEDCAICTRDEFESFVAPRQFTVTVSAAGSKPWERTGVILPYEQKLVKDGGFQVILPERADNGTLKVLPYVIGAGNTGNAEYSDGFLPFTPELFNRQMNRMLGTPYGWGDMDNGGSSGFDCSSTVNSVMKCFGIYMPRNSSQYRYSGAALIDLSGKSTEEKYSLVEEHPFSVLAAPGHVMFNNYLFNMASSDLSMASKHSVIHNTTAFLMPDYASDKAEKQDTLSKREFYECVRTELEDMYSGDGTLYLNKINLMLDFEPFFVPASVKGNN